MSTRKLIFAAMACAVTLLVAGTVWLLTLDTTVNEIRDDPRTTAVTTSSTAPVTPSPSSTTAP